MDSVILSADDAAPSIFHKDDFLNLDGSEESFVILAKDPSDEGVSDCDYSDRQSTYSSASHSNTEHELHEILNEKEKRGREFEKIATYQKTVLSTLHEMTGKLDLMNSTSESNNDTDRSVNSLDDPSNKVDTTRQTETSEQDPSEESEVSLNSVETTQTSLAETLCVNMEAKSVTVDGGETLSPTATESQCISTETAVEIAADKPVESQESDSLISQSCSSLEDPAIASSSPVKQCISACDKIMEELRSKRSCILSDGSLTEQDRAERRKQLIDFHDEICEKRNEIINHWQACLDHAKLAEPMNEQQALEREKAKVAEKMLEKEVSRLRENCSDLSKKLEDAEAQIDALLEEQYIWSEERDVLEDTNKILEDKLKSRIEKCEVLEKENALLIAKSDKIQMYLGNLRDEVADARTLISEVREQNADLQEIENAVDVYKHRSEMQETNISRLCTNEKSHLCQIESLTDENKILRDYIKHLLSRFENAS